VDQLVAPCAACYLNLKKTDRLMAEHADFNQKVNEALAAGGLHYRPGSVTVRHMLDVICDDIGEAGRARQGGQARWPACGWPPTTVARWFGLTPKMTMPEYPMKMDNLLTWLGAEVVDYPVKAHCCGGHMTQISEPQAFELIRRLLQSAQDYEADLIVCMCPMCQLNLDGYQGRVNGYFNTEFKLPIVYFTQVMGIAFGLDPKKLGFGKELVAALPVIRAKVNGLVAQAPRDKTPDRQPPARNTHSVTKPHLCDN
jgi:heterodisulfide reductase subunit B